MKQNTFDIAKSLLINIDMCKEIKAHLEENEYFVLSEKALPVRDYLVECLTTKIADLQKTFEAL